MGCGVGRVCEGQEWARARLTSTLPRPLAQASASVSALPAPVQAEDTLQSHWVHLSRWGWEVKEQ